MCERRFGSATDICKWGAGGRVSSKVIHSVLSHFENVVGFWRGVENVRHGSLVVFEWDSCKIAGYRITPARSSTYEVCKVPFVAIGWIGVSHKQRPVCLLDPDWAQLVPGLLDVRSSSNSVNGSLGEGRRSTRPLQIPVSPTSPAAKGASSSSGVLTIFQLSSCANMNGILKLHNNCSCSYALYKLKHCITHLPKLI